MTCNLAAWREDLVAVNGLDESYSGWGLEDSDLVIRLLRSGLRRKSARFATPVLHLWHREQDRAALTENRRRLEAILMSDSIRAVRGWIDISTNLLPLRKTPRPGSRIPKDGAPTGPPTRWGPRERRGRGFLRIRHSHRNFSGGRLSGTYSRGIFPSFHSRET